MGTRLSCRAWDSAHKIPDIQTKLQFAIKYKNNDDVYLKQPSITVLVITSKFEKWKFKTDSS